MLLNKDILVKYQQKKELEPLFLLFGLIITVLVSAREELIYSQ